MAQPTRWSFPATIDQSDKARLRAFVRNEINYFNEILLGFSSRLRTSPDVFSEVNEAMLGEIAAGAYQIRNFTADTLPENLVKFKSVIYQDGKIALSERVLLLLDVVVSPTVLHPATKRAMAIEFLREHVRLASALSRTTAKIDQVLQHPVELLPSAEARTKRHIQLPKSAVSITANGVITAYNSKPIMLKNAPPPEANWNLLILRDEDRPGEAVNGWVAEFRQEKTDYLPRLTDTPFQKPRPISAKAAERY